MSQPAITVIMPVFNNAPFLDAAIRSVMEQDFADFELIIINDGSTDGSGSIIHHWNDPRIRLLDNEKNQGLVFTLNRGLDEARGKWIARMDGDDLCLPGRFSAQIEYLAQHPEVDVLATRVQLINEQGVYTGIWSDDEKAISPKDILNYLPKNNCIAHPTIMAKAEVIKRFRYNQSQSQAEDYDLWLRMAAAGCNIHKLDKFYLSHRMVGDSFTRSRQQNVFRKLALTKFRFVREAKAQGQKGVFLRKTYVYAIIDLILSWLKPLKRYHVV